MRLRKLCFKPFTFWNKMRRAWAKFFICFFSFKLPLHLIRRTAIVHNDYGFILVWLLPLKIQTRKSQMELKPMLGGEANSKFLKKYFLRGILTD